jgi:hypothetical protein
MQLQDREARPLLVLLLSDIWPACCMSTCCAWQVRATKRARVKGRFAKGPVLPSPGGGPAESMATNDHDDEAGHAGEHGQLGGAGGSAVASAGTKRPSAGQQQRPAASTLAQVCIAGPSEEMTEVGRA